MRLPGPLLAAMIAVVSTDAGAQAPPPADPLREHYQAAQTFQLAGDLDRAETEYAREVIPRALRRLASLASAEGRLDEARAHLEAARAQHPSTSDVTLDLVVVLLRSGDIQAARRLAREISNAEPDNARARRLHGKALLLSGENAAAREELERSMTIAAEFDTSLSLAYANLRVRRLAEARALFDEMVIRNPSADVRSFIARAWLENGLVEPAASYLEQALRLDEAHEPSRRLLADIKAGRPYDPGSLQTVILGEPSAFDSVYGTRMRQQSIDVVANSYFNLGVIYSRRDRPSDAAAAMVRAREWKPGLEGIDRAAGAALFYADRFDEAIEPLERHLSAHPSDAAARKLVETSYLMTGRTRTEKAATAAAPAAEGGRPGDLDLLAASLASGRNEEVEPQLWAIIAREPANARALALLGTLLVSAGRFPEAESILRRATEVAPTDRDAWLARARAVARTSGGTESRAVLEAALRRVPGDPVLETALARTLLELDEPRAALEHLSRVKESDRPPDALGVEIGARIALGDLVETRARLADAASRVDEPTAASLVGLLVEHDRAREAVALADAVHARGFKGAPLLAAGARARLAAGDRAGAERWYELALDADSTSTPALAGLGDLIAARDPERATELFLIARSHGDRTPSLLSSLALSATAALRFDEALEAATALAAIRPDDVEAVNLVGTIQLQRTDWIAAEDSFARMAALDARDARAPLGLGIARHGQQRYADAETALERSLALDPTQGEALYQLAIVARDDGRADVAIVRLERAVAQAPRHQAAHLALGTLLVEVAEYERARPILERAIGLDPSLPAPYYQLGLLFARTKEPERARQAMEQFRRLRESRVTSARP